MWDNWWNSQPWEFLSGLMLESQAATQLTGTFALSGGFQSWSLLSNRMELISLLGIPMRGLPCGFSLSRRAEQMHDREEVSGRTYVDILFLRRILDSGSNKSSV